VDRLLFFNCQSQINIHHNPEGPRFVAGLHKSNPEFLLCLVILAKPHNADHDILLKILP